MTHIVVLAFSNHLQSSIHIHPTKYLQLNIPSPNPSHDPRPLGIIAHEHLQALTVPIILLLASQSTRTRSRSGVSLTTALSPRSNSSTTRSSLLSSSGLLDSDESGPDGSSSSSSLSRDSSLRGGGSLGSSSSLSGGRSRDILLSSIRRSRTEVSRTSVSLNVGSDLGDLKRGDVVGDTGDERSRRATSQLSRRRVDAVLEARAAERRRAGGPSVYNESADLRALVGDGLRDAGEHVALDERLGAGVCVEGVAFHVLEVVVDRVEGAGCAVLAELGGAARDVVEVVAVEGDLVACGVLESRTR